MQHCQHTVLIAIRPWKEDQRLADGSVQIVEWNMTETETHYEVEKWEFLTVLGARDVTQRWNE